MREIKFRGKRSDNGEWVFGYVTYIDDDYYIQRHNPMVLPCDDKVFPSTVGQYTGLKDKNGTEIYEGDVVKFVILKGQEDYNPPKALTRIIEWARGCWGFTPTHPELCHPEDRQWCPFCQSEDDDWDMNYFTVIGNIHDNPELLEEEE